MKLKNRVTLTIESMAYGGEGVARLDAFVLFVPLTAPGDVVEAEITTLKKRFGRARLLNVLSPSPLRVTPRCRYFGRCGGCCYQHIDYPHQLEIKQKQVSDAMVKIGGLDVLPKINAVASPEIYGYRGKATLHTSAPARRQIGLMDVSGGRLLDIERCDLMHESINDQLCRLRTCPDAVLWNTDVTLWSGDPEAFAGPVMRHVKDRTFLVPSDGFFQNNLYLTGRMVDEVLACMGKDEIQTAVDACCGVGLFSLFMAARARRVVGIEIHEPSVAYARENAARQGIDNVQFIAGDIANILTTHPTLCDRSADLVLLDPPRAGLMPQALRAVLELKPARMIYVSCNPATQARDVARLVQAGYSLTGLVLLDMFPQTQHIETILSLEIHSE